MQFELKQHKLLAAVLPGKYNLVVEYMKRYPNKKCSPLLPTFLFPHKKAVEWSVSISGIRVAQLQLCNARLP